jgi:hypothetical protein
VEFVRQLAPAAGRLILVARRREALEALRDEIAELRPDLPVIVEARDLTRPAEVEALLDRLRADEIAVDVLVNNAGSGDAGFFEGSDWTKVERMLELNVVGFTHLLLRLYAGMVERKRGGVLLVSSGFGLVFLPLYGPYVGSKHYVTGLAESLRCESGFTGVAVTQVCPGPVDTPFHDLAGSRPGFATPPLLKISAERCVRQALRGFRRGRAMVVPTWWMWSAVTLGTLVPRPVLRWSYALAAAVLLRRSA